MMATFNSKPWQNLHRWAAAAVLIVASGIIFAHESQKQIFSERARLEFQRARTQYQSNPGNATNAWRFASAAFDLADFATSDNERAAVANAGIAACRPLVAREPKIAAGHYYLAMNLGQLARTELIGALNLVKEMEREFKMASDLDARFDHAGPERNLGLLYRDAPGWPASIGNQSQARSLLRQAVKLAPDYPENYLQLIESYLKWKDPDGAKRELRALDAIWPAARASLTGEKWEQSWGDWSPRRAAARHQLDAAPAP
jgi:hypothetical protein